MRSKPLKYRDLFRILRKYHVYSVPGGRHQLHLIKGNPPKDSYPIPYRGKEGEDLPGFYVKAIRRHFKLTPEDGISDEEFYG